MTTSTEVLLSALNWRYATKAFDPAKKVPTEQWEALEQALILTPSSFGIQPWKFIIMQDAALRESLVEHSWGQRQVADCSHLVVIAIKKQLSEADIDAYLQRIVEVRGGDLASLAGYRNMMTGHRATAEKEGWLESWAKLQAYIALGQLMTSAALLGIDTCPMEGFVPSKYDEALNLAPQGLTAAVLCPVGYRAAGDKYATLPKVRALPKDVVEHR